MKKQIRTLAIVVVAALISFASGAGAEPNTFDADGNLCLGVPIEKIGEPMELWAGVGTASAGELVGYITFDANTATIDLTDVDGIPGPDPFPWFATEVHIHFGDTLDDFPLTTHGEPKVGQFCYKEEGIYDSVVEIPIPAFATFGAIHVAVERDYSDVYEFADVLPDGTVQMSIDFPQPDSYVDMTLAEAGDLNGLWDGWCVDDDVRINEDTVYDAYLYSSYDTATVASLPFEHPENFPKVNYLLNNFSVGDIVEPLSDSCAPSIACGSVEPPQALTKGDIQRAIWVLIEDAPYSTEGLGPWTQTKVNAILCDVNANGENFIPGCSEETAFIAVPVENNDIQMIVGQMIISSLEIECLTGEETAWGDGKHGEKFNAETSWATYFEYDETCVPE